MESRNKKKFDPQLIAVFFVYAVAALFFFTSLSIKDPNSRFFPQVMCGLSVLLATIYMMQILRGKAVDEDAMENPFAGGKRACIIGCFLALYIALNYLGGYYVASVIFMPITMRFLGQKNWKTIVLVTVIYNVVIYLLFDLLLGMQMPESILFS